MSNHQLNDLNYSLTRRSLFLGIGGGAVLSLLSGSELAHALQNQPISSLQLDPAAIEVLKEYLRTRARVADGGRLNDVLQFINPERRNLIDFESARFDALSTLGSPSRWNGTIDQVSSQSRIIDAFQNGSNATVLLKDWTSINWRPAPPLVPIERSPVEWSLVRKDPLRYGLNVPSWTPTESGFATIHLITLENVHGRWLVTSDGYNEFTLAGSSPDYSADLEAQASSQSSEAFGSTSLRAKIQPSNKKLPKAENLTSYTFDYQAAITYARTYYLNYNPNYRNLNSVGGDCANFVSQSFKAGGYPNDGTWYPYSSAWVNNLNLRNWLINSGRGHDSSLGGTGLADIINYDWTNNGSLDHVALVTDIVGGVPMVTGHNTDEYNKPYYSWFIGSAPGMTMKYTGTYLYYSA